MNATKLSPAKKSPDRRDARHRAQVEGGNKPIAPGSRDWIGRASCGTRNLLCALQRKELALNGLP